MKFNKSSLSYSLRISSGELEYLMECHERSIMQLLPQKLSACSFAKKLIRKGLVETAPHATNGRQIISVFITTKGRELLSAYSSS